MISSAGNRSQSLVLALLCLVLLLQLHQTFRPAGGPAGSAVVSQQQGAAGEVRSLLQGNSLSPAPAPPAPPLAPRRCNRTMADIVSGRVQAALSAAGDARQPDAAIVVFLDVNVKYMLELSWLYSSWLLHCLDREFDLVVFANPEVLKKRSLPQHPGLRIIAATPMNAPGSPWEKYVGGSERLCLCLSFRPCVCPFAHPSVRLREKPAVAGGRDPSCGSPLYVTALGRGKRGERNKKHKSGVALFLFSCFPCRRLVRALRFLPRPSARGTPRAVYTSARVETDTRRPCLPSLSCASKSPSIRALLVLKKRSASPSHALPPPQVRFCQQLHDGVRRHDARPSAAVHSLAENGP